jgi:uncharacterized protein
MLFMPKRYRLDLTMKHLFNRLLASVVLGVSFFAVHSQKALAQDCPPQQLPLERAREYIEKIPAKNAGLLWRFEKSGRISWLYGTMHLMHIDYAKPGSQIMMGMRSSDVLAVEINFYAPQSATAPSNKRFALNVEQLNRLKKAYLKDCISGDPAQLLVQPLMLSQASRNGLFWGYSPDARLMQIAQRSGKPIFQLETIDQQSAALAPQNQSEFDEQINASLSSFENGAISNHVATMAKAWQHNDLQAFVVDTEKAAATNPSFLNRINDERNQIMAEKIDLLHMEGKRVFVAVGATHMTGSKSLPKLLQDKGYSVNFVPLKN